MHQIEADAKPIRWIQIMIDFAKNGADGHQMDPKNEENRVQRKNSMFNGLLRINAYYDIQ